MRVVICWTGISGYTAACWRALAGRAGVELSVLAFRPSDRQEQTAFTQDLVRDLPCRLLDEREQNDPALVRDLVASHRPQVVYVPGWFVPAFTRLVTSGGLGAARFVMGMDTPLRNDWRQRVGRLRSGGFARRMDRVIVASERAWQYARYLGVPERKIVRGLYACDWRHFARSYDRRAAEATGWPRRFLYVGRYAAEKGIPVLLAAYQGYRGRVSDPWPLGCCGRGPLAERLRRAPGVEDLGFVQPQEQAGVMERHGAFVIASTYEPWGVAIAEACAAGLPVLCTEACGASIDLVRSHYNGLTVASGDADALTRALVWCHEAHDRLPGMGLRSRELAAAFSAEVWAERWWWMLRELIGADAVTASATMAPEATAP